MSPRNLGLTMLAGAVSWTAIICAFTGSIDLALVLLILTGVILSLMKGQADVRV
jgi:hypothetical protein